LLRSHWARTAIASAIGAGDELACGFPYGWRDAGWRALGHAMRSAAAWPGLAIFEADHSSSPLLKIAATFFDSTSRAAVSASARSLRSRSRSSSLMRLRSARGLWAGAYVLWLGQRSGAAGAPLVELGRVHAVLAAPGARPTRYASTSRPRSRSRYLRNVERPFRADAIRAFLRCRLKSSQGQRASNRSGPCASPSYR
jgi:hypothetical protein